MTSFDRAARLGPMTADDAAHGIIPRFRRVLDVLTDDVAVVDAEGQLTFAQLADRGAAYSATVRRAVPAGEAVAVLFGHRTEAVAAILGVLASGRPLLVLDARTPAPRLRELVHRAGATAVLTETALLEVAGALGLPVLGPEAVRPAPRETLWAEDVDPSAPAILAFTSGSTGTPKVVVNNGHMLVADAWRNSAATGCYDADDVIAHTLPMAFHAGLMVTVAGLLVGSTMRLFDTRSNGIAALAPWIASVAATVMHTSPAILRAFVGAGPTAEQLRSLTSVTIAGEPAHGRDVEGLRPLLRAGCTIRNRYGSSETGLIAEYIVETGHPPLEGPLPVGTPVGNTALACLAEDGTPLPDGTPGVLAVTRDHVASGYRGNPEATALAFFDEPDGRHTYRTSDVGRLDGSRLTLLGRRDHSVKIRGYLVEPGEVDAVLFTLPDVAEALTVGLPRENTESYRLVSYVVSTAERPNAASVRSTVRGRLPDHLVPESVVFVDALPRTERGKLDRSALPPPPPVDTGEEPISEWERLVAQVWCRALDLESVGRHADFFALGGDSLIAEALTEMVVSDLGIDAGDVSAELLAQAPTLAEYARRAQRPPERRSQILGCLRAGGDRPPLFLVAGGGGLGIGFVPLVRHLPEDQPVWTFHSHGLESRAVPDWSIPAAARRNIKLLRGIQPTGPYHIGGHSYGGLVALEMAQQLRAAGEEIAMLIVLDSFPPDPALIPGPDPERSRMRRAQDVVGVLMTGLIPTPGVGHYWHFHAQSRLLSKWYRTTPYPGPTTVAVADSEDRESRARWGPHLSGDWTLHEVSGGHITMMRDAHVASVARVVTGAIERARQTSALAGRDVTR